MKKEKWSSDFGFLMAAAGSAVGLGNIWKFPYVTGKSGGAVFLVVYFILLIILGVPVLLSEMCIGRSTRKNPIDACRTINKNWGFTGAFGIIGAFIILCYYGVIGGWVIKYIIHYIFNSSIDNASEYFDKFSSGTFMPILLHFIFTFCCALIVINGISKGIEKICKFFMPALLIMIIILTFKSFSLDGSINGIKFFLKPDFSKLQSFSDWAVLLTGAMGQVFFSLSLGMGTLITYGAYLDKSTSLTKSAIYIPLIDFIIALLSGLMILPAVFACGISPTAGSGMIFITLPQVFAQISGGRFFAVIFFLLILFAAVTSAISLLEVIVSYIMNRLKLSRNNAALISAFVISVIGIPASMSFGKLSNFKIFNMNFFDLLNFISDKLLMPLGALGICILCGYVWKIDNLSAEAGVKSPFVKNLLNISIKYISPAMIFIIFITSLFNL